MVFMGICNRLLTRYMERRMKEIEMKLKKNWGPIRGGLRCQTSLNGFVKTGGVLEFGNSVDRINCQVIK